MVIWANLDFTRSPKLYDYVGKPDFEALRALSLFLRTFVFDQSGTLEWPFPFKTMLNQSVGVRAMPVKECFDTQATALWNQSQEPITVLCGGDIDSVAVLAALIKTASDRSLIQVHYTDASVARYPKLFNELLPALKITTLKKTPYTLIDSSVVRYCDGRSGDDFQASYPGYLDHIVPESLRTGSIEAVIDHIVSRTPGRSENKQAAKDGLERWVKNQAFPIKTPWQLVLYMYRVCFTQTSSWAGILLEDDTVSAFNRRVPFYDTHVFSGATRYLAEAMNWPANETIGMKKYVYDFFGDKEWYDTPGLIDIHSIIHPGKLASCWLNHKGEATGYRQFPI